MFTGKKNGSMAGHGSNSRKRLWLISLCMLLAMALLAGTCLAMAEEPGEETELPPLDVPYPILELDTDTEVILR